MADASDFETAGVYDPAAADAEDRLALLRWLDGQGFDLDEIAEAAREGKLVTLASRRQLHPGPHHTLKEAAELAGLTVEQFDLVRRSGGLAPAEDGVETYSAADIESFAVFGRDSTLFTQDELLQFVRVLGSSVARMAEAAVSLYIEDVEIPILDAGGTMLEHARKNLQALTMLTDVTEIMGSLFQLHMEQAIRRSQASRSTLERGSAARLAVGFVDLVGFTPLSIDVDSRELSIVVREFERRAYEVVADHGGRVVKLIGDEVMFIAVDPDEACAVGLALTETFRAGDTGRHVTPRGGLAYGDLLTRGGDYYGPVVNLAARMAELAVPNELLVTPELAEQVDTFAFEPAGRRLIRGFPEPVLLLALRA